MTGPIRRLRDEVASWPPDEQLDEARRLLNGRFKSHSEREAMVRHLEAAARITHQLEPAEADAFELWFLLATINTRQLIEEIDRFLEVAIADGAVSLDSLDYGDDLRGYLEDRDIMLALI